MDLLRKEAIDRLRAAIEWLNDCSDSHYSIRLGSHPKLILSDGALNRLVDAIVGIDPNVLADATRNTREATEPQASEERCANCDHYAVTHNQGPCRATKCPCVSFITRAQLVAYQRTSRELLTTHQRTNAVATEVKQAVDDLSRGATQAIINGQPLPAELIELGMWRLMAITTRFTHTDGESPTSERPLHPHDILRGIDSLRQQRDCAHARIDKEREEFQREADEVKRLQSELDTLRRQQGVDPISLIRHMRVDLEDSTRDDQPGIEQSRRWFRILHMKLIGMNTSNSTSTYLSSDRWITERLGEDPGTTRVNLSIIPRDQR